MITDEQVIDAFLKHRSYAAAAREIGVSRQMVEQRLRRMAMYGVAVPGSLVRSGVRRYPPNRVAELNRYIHEKTRLPG